MRHGKLLRLCLVALTATMAVVAATTAGAAPAKETPAVLKSAPAGTILGEPVRGGLDVCDYKFLNGVPLGPIQVLESPWRRGLNLSIPAMKESAVAGAVKMKHNFKMTETKTTRTFKGNGIPPFPVGEFPILPDNPAYKFYSKTPTFAPWYTSDKIPIEPYKLDVSITKYPKANKKPSCLPSLVMGVALDGITWHAEIAADQTPEGQVRFFDPNGGIPTDNCFGHPWDAHYHIHGFSWKCLTKKIDSGTKASPLYGYAFDGFGIYGPLDENGKWITNDQLDECHGRTARVMFNGKMQKIYHYVLNNEYPYSIGCFRGTPAKLPHNLMHNMS